MLISSDEMGAHVADILRNWAKENYSDLGAHHEELFDIVDVTFNDSVITITVMDIIKTKTQVFTVTVHGV